MRTDFHMDFELVTEGFELFSDTFLDIVDQWYPTQRPYTPNSGYAPERIKQSTLYDALCHLKPYVIDREYDLTKYYCEFTYADYLEAQFIPPDELLIDVESLYRLLTLLRPHIDTIFYEKNFTAVIAFSNFVNCAYQNFRLDFGYSQNLFLSSNQETPKLDDCVFTQHELLAITKLSKKMLSDHRRDGKLTSFNHRKKIRTLKNSNISKEYGGCPEAIEDYNTFNDQLTNQGTVSVYKYFDTIRYLSSYKNYKPTRFKLIRDGREVIPALTNNKLLTSKLPENYKGLPKELVNSILPTGFFSSFRKGKSTLSLYQGLCLDRALFELSPTSEPYSAFSFFNG